MLLCEVRLVCSIFGRHDGRAFTRTFEKSTDCSNDIAMDRADMRGETRAFACLEKQCNFQQMKLSMTRGEIVKCERF